jgi:hypothetical protein
LTRNSVAFNYAFGFMNDEFELNEDFDFDEDFSDDLADFDDFNENNVEDILMRTAVLQKNNMVALLCIKSATAGAAICRVDPREANPAVQIYDDPTAALEWFTKSLRTSRKNGWTIVYDGLPLQG